jgi:hypothetical protein
VRAAIKIAATVRGGKTKINMWCSTPNRGSTYRPYLHPGLF